MKSVVSGKSEPDTITLKRENGLIRIDSQMIGGKSDMVVLNVNGGTEIKTVTQENTKLLSITEKQALHLGYIGTYIEKSFGHPLDIEWAYENVTE